MKICLDPGHFGNDYNPGVAAGYVESNFTWTYYLLMKERLERYGVEVIGTRASKADYPKKKNGDDDLQARGKMAEGCDLFISIHSNAAEDDKGNIKPEVDSVFTHWSVRSGGENVALAIGNALTDFFRSEWGDCQDPIMYAQESTNHPGYDWFGVLKGAASVGVPGVIIEHSFHTNVRYCEWAMTPGNIEKMANVEVDTIAKLYGLEPTTYGIYYIPLNVDLKKGDKGEEVKKLQMRMRQVDASFDEEVRKHSFSEQGIPDGSFGGKMVTTMKRFQFDAGIPETGELDFATRAVLNTSVILYTNRVRELINEKNEIATECEIKVADAEHKTEVAEKKIADAVAILES